MRTTFFLCLLALSACELPCEPLYFESLTHYQVNPLFTLPSGVKVDDGGYALDLLTLDTRIKAIVSCLQEKMRTVKNKPEWDCPLSQESRLINFSLSCVTVRVVDPVLSPCSNEQFIRACEDCLPLAASDALCLEKGIVPTPECPCLWRTALQGDYVIITPPALHLWDLGRIVSSCNAVWFSDYAECLSF